MKHTTQPRLIQSNDLPLFSGTPVSAQGEVFNPPTVQKQDTLFDIRPEFGPQPTPNDYRIFKGSPSDFFDTAAAQADGLTLEQYRARLNK